jgi:hypothetical protein
MVGNSLLRRQIAGLYVYEQVVLGIGVQRARRPSLFTRCLTQTTIATVWALVVLGLTDQSTIARRSMFGCNHSVCPSIVVVELLHPGRVSEAHLSIARNSQGRLDQPFECGRTSYHRSTPSHTALLHTKQYWKSPLEMGRIFHMHVPFWASSP